MSDSLTQNRPRLPFLSTYLCTVTTVYKNIIVYQYDVCRRSQPNTFPVFPGTVKRKIECIFEGHRPLWGLFCMLPFQAIIRPHMIISEQNGEDKPGSYCVNNKMFKDLGEMKKKETLIHIEPIKEVYVTLFCTV